MPRPLPAGKFDGVDTAPLPIEVPRIPKPKPHRAPAGPSTVRYAKCPGCDRSRGVTYIGEHLAFRLHVHPTTHVQCSRAGQWLCKVWDQAAKQPSERHCSCYRG